MRETASPLTPLSLQSGLFGWFTDGTPEARLALLAASLGWMLDGLDITLYALVLGAIGLPETRGRKLI